MLSYVMFFIIVMCTFLIFSSAMQAGSEIVAFLFFHGKLRNVREKSRNFAGGHGTICI